MPPKCLCKDTGHAVYASARSLLLPYPAAITSGVVLVGMPSKCSYQWKPELQARGAWLHHALKHLSAAWTVPSRQPALCPGLALTQAHQPTPHTLVALAKSQCCGSRR